MRSVLEAISLLSGSLEDFKRLLVVLESRRSEDILVQEQEEEEAASLLSVSTLSSRSSTLASSSSSPPPSSSQLPPPLFQMPSSLSSSSSCEEEEEEGRKTTSTQTNPLHPNPNLDPDPHQQSTARYTNSRSKRKQKRETRPQEGGRFIGDGLFLLDDRDPDQDQDPLSLSFSNEATSFGREAFEVGSPLVYRSIQLEVEEEGGGETAPLSPHDASESFGALRLSSSQQEEPEGRTLSYSEALVVSPSAENTNQKREESFNSRQSSNSNLSSSSSSSALHKKLSSPDRKRNLSPKDIKILSDSKLQQAETNRLILQETMIKKLSTQQRRAQDAKEFVARKQQEAFEALRLRLEQSEKRKQDHLREIQEKGKTAAIRVEEVHFINSLTSEMEANDLRLRREELEQRIEQGRERRSEYLRQKADGVRGWKSRQALKAEGGEEELGELVELERKGGDAGERKGGSRGCRPAGRELMLLRLAGVQGKRSVRGGRETGA